MTDCFKCKYFKQEHVLDITYPGLCKWNPSAAPVWLEYYIRTNDFYYGPRRSIRRHRDGTGYSSLGIECKTFKPVSAKIYKNRCKEDWYDQEDK